MCIDKDVHRPYTALHNKYYEQNLNQLLILVLINYQATIMGNERDVRHSRAYTTASVQFTASIEMLDNAAGQAPGPSTESDLGSS